MGNVLIFKTENLGKVFILKLLLFVNGVLG